MSEQRIADYERHSAYGASRREATIRLLSATMRAYSELMNAATDPDNER